MPKTKKEEKKQIKKVSAKAKTKTEPKKQSSAEPKPDKDPTIAAILSLLFPALGFFYLGNAKKAVIHIILFFVDSFVMFMITALTIICFPVMIIPFIHYLVLVYDTYKAAKGEKEILDFVNKF